MIRNRNFWITVCVFNLCLVAFLGFGLRSKILFYLPGIDFGHLESAHSHFAFGGWAGLALMTLLIFDVLPQERSAKLIYPWLLAGIEISSLGMALLFPSNGYNAITIFFSSFYMVVVMVFVPVYIRDLLRTETHKSIKLLGTSAVMSLILSFVGTFGLVYILASKSTNALLYRDCIYTFLHFQYNGFFTLSVFTLFFNHLLKRQFTIAKSAHMFALFICLSIIPALFLSLLWHNNKYFYLLAGIAGLFMVISVIYLSRFLLSLHTTRVFTSKIANTFLHFAILAFMLKTLLNVGTIYPPLGHAIYSDRPVIIGFLHLVFLGVLTFYLFASFIQHGCFTKNGRIVALPFIVFSFGIFANEILLAVQGLGILFKTNHEIYKWLLWAAAIILFAGAVMIFIARLYIILQKKKP